MKSKYYLKIKEIINLIYELTKDGYQGEFKSMGRTTGAIATFLKKKNILKSESCSNGKPGVSYYYKWNETVPQPSDVFIRQIQDEYYELNRERKRKWVQENNGITSDNQNKTTMKPETYQKVKDAVYTIYNLTKDGFQGEFKSMSNTIRIVNTILIREKVVELKNVYIGSKDGRTCHYKWKRESTQPAETFISHIANEYSKYLKQRNDKARKKTNKEIPDYFQKEENPKPGNLPSNGKIITNEQQIEKISDIEIWKELKRRGWTIEGEKLTKQETME